MILADTSVWIAHFRHDDPKLAHYLDQGLILLHPWICGELACGNLKNRESSLADLQALPTIRVATDSDVLALIEEREIWGRGLGWIDVHLLASALLSRCRLWTLDKRLSEAARQLSLV